jgi:sulfoxide reductase catalytic subunit YedY
MQIKMRNQSAASPSEVTPREVWRQRRRLVAAAAGLTASGGASLAVGSAQARSAGIMQGGDPAAQKLLASPSKLSTPERATPYKLVTTYNNFYEFGTEKDDPVKHAHRLRTRPWSVMVDGEVAKPRSFDIDELLTLAPLEERIYRMRCVEGWSMVIPWIGYPMAELIRRVEPTPKARYVEFVTLADPKQMPGLAIPVIGWPYMEALRLDEAMHPLTLLTLGLYGEILPKQNGAPVRMVVPWKYGFKSAKSLVRIRFVEREPVTSWMRSSPEEYGFYSNVNPEVSHPRWSQATERRLGEDGFMQRRRPTLMFNGYADQVASLYAGMDLRRNF